MEGAPRYKLLTLFVDTVDTFYTVDMVYSVYTVDTVDTVYTIQTALHCLDSSKYAYIYC